MLTVVFDHKISDDWINQIVLIHSEELNVGFMSILGNEFLRRFYRFVSQSKIATLIAVLDDNKICGFICGLQNRGEMIKGFLKENWLFLMILCIKSMGNLVRWKRFLQLILKSKSDKIENLPNSELFSFAVARNYQGKKIGKTLFSALREQFNKVSITSFKIIASYTQPKAMRFYRDVGAKVVGNCWIGPLKCDVFVFDDNEVENLK